VKLFFLLAVQFFFSVPALLADWQWENDLATAKITGDEYRATCRFENHGAAPVTVTDLHFSCPCTVYHFKAATVRPGRSGILTLYITRDSVQTPDQELLVIAVGPDSTTAKELTIRIPHAASAKSD